MNKFIIYFKNKGKYYISGLKNPQKQILTFEGLQKKCHFLDEMVLLRYKKNT